MSYTTYTYTVGTDFTSLTGTEIDLNVLDTQVSSAISSPALAFVIRSAASVVFYFPSALTSPQQTTLTGVVNAYVFTDASEYVVTNSNSITLTNKTFGDTVFNGTGSTSNVGATIDVDPASTALTGSSNYYWSYFVAPPTSGSTTGIASTIYVAGAPTGGATNYAMWVGAGASLFGGSVTVANGGTLSVGTSGTTSTFNVYGGANHYSSLSFLGTGSATAASATLYSNPASTALTGSSAYYFNYLNAPTTTASTFTGSASTLYIAGAPTVTTGGTGYSLQVAAGKVLLAGSLQYSTGASAGYVLVCDASGNATWVNPNTIESFDDGTAALPSIYFLAQPGTGFYRPGSGQIGVELAGANYATFATTGLTLVNGTTLGVGTSGTTSSLSVFGSSTINSTATFTGAGSATVSSSTVYVAPATTALTGANNYTFTYLAVPTTSGSTTGTTTSLYLAGAATGGATNYALRVAAGISLFSGVLSLGGTGSTTAASAAFYSNPATTALTGASAYYFNYFNSPTTTAATFTGTATTLFVAGAPTVTTGGTGYALQVAAGASLFGGNVTAATGTTVSVGTSGTTSTLSIFGATNCAGVASFTGAGSTTAASASIYSNPSPTGITGASAYYFNYLAAPTTTAVTFTGTATTLFVAGAPTSTTGGTGYALQVAAGASLFGGNVTAANGTTVSVGTSGTTSTLSIFGASNHAGIASFTGVGSITAANASLYSNPATTALTGASAYYFNYLNTPTTTATTFTGTATTLYVAGAPTVTTGGTGYALQVATGKVLLAGSLQYSTGAAAGYVLTSDATGNATWASASSVTVSFADGTSALPGIFFTSQPGTGFYRPGSGQIGVELAGANYATFATTGLTLVNGTTLSVGTSGTTSTLSIFGASNHAGIASFTGTGSTTAASAALYSNPATTALTGASAYYFNYLNSPTTTAATFTGTATTLFVAGAPTVTTGGTGYALQVAAGASLFGGNVTAANGTTVSVGTSGTTSTLSIFGASNHAGIASFTGAGSTTAASASIYSNPTTTALTGASAYYFNYLNSPTTTATTFTGTATTLYVAGAPTVTTGGTGYALQVAAGKVLLAGSLQYSTGAAAGYVLTSDATGNATWASASSVAVSFADGTSALPGIFFTSQPGTGFYRPGSGQIGVELAGANYATFATTGLTLVNGTTLSVGTSGTTSTLSIFGASNHAGIASFTGTGSTTAASAALYSNPATTALTGASAYYFNYLNSPTTTAATFTGTATTLFVAGAPTVTTGGTGYALQVAAGASLFGGNITAANGTTVSVGTSGTTSTLNVFGGSNFSGTATFTDTGSSTTTASTIYVAPASTALTGSSNYYFTYFATPTTTSTTTGATSTVYIANAPTGGASNYALQVAAGKSLFAGSLQYSTGASSGYVLTSDASGNATWTAPSSLSVTTTYFSATSSSTFSISNTVTTPTTITGMTLTPTTAGTYLFRFLSVFYASTSSRAIQFQFAKNGTAVSGTNFQITSTVSNNTQTVAFEAFVSVNGSSDAITVQVATVSGNATGVTLPTLKSFTAVRVGA